ncbi:hypothetical protein [Bradyrhizobium glycinis]|uniref:hypothetical protein n=1 Tax=Bradyrhizobium glycinis TaxID=2751812 RepID=UPI0018D68163|nr:hypothetical protein [Bradyrhizobium glycinis]MBH5371025.1 hypothetical protein [Bradyrhizobium glycinis]
MADADADNSQARTAKAQLFGRVFVLEKACHVAHAGMARIGNLSGCAKEFTAALFNDGQSHSHQLGSG